MSQIYKSAVGSTPSIPTQFSTDVGGPVIPTANNVNVFGGTGAQTVGSGSTITINVKNDGFSWSEISTNTAPATPQKGFFCTAALTLTLPPTSALSLGSIVIALSTTSSNVVIQAQADQFIQVGSDKGLIGGTATFSTTGTACEFIFQPSSSTWLGISPVGTIAVA